MPAKESKVFRYHEKNPNEHIENYAYEILFSSYLIRDENDLIFLRSTKTMQI